MTNFPDGMTRYDWDHVEGRDMPDEEQEREPTLEEVQAELRRLSAIRRARRKAQA